MGVHQTAHIENYYMNEECALLVNIATDYRFCVHNIWHVWHSFLAPNYVGKSTYFVCEDMQ